MSAIGSIARSMRPPRSALKDAPPDEQPSRGERRTRATRGDRMRLIPVVYHAAAAAAKRDQVGKQMGASRGRGLRGVHRPGTPNKTGGRRHSARTLWAGTESRSVRAMTKVYAGVVDEGTAQSAQRVSGLAL